MFATRAENDNRGNNAAQHPLTKRKKAPAG
jgi:hypothetical protein